MFAGQRMSHVELYKKKKRPLFHNNVDHATSFPPSPLAASPPAAASVLQPTLTPTQDLPVPDDSATSTDVETRENYDEPDDSDIRKGATSRALMSYQVKCRAKAEPSDRSTTSAAADSLKSYGRSKGRHKKLGRCLIDHSLPGRPCRGGQKAMAGDDESEGTGDDSDDDFASRDRRKVKDSSAAQLRRVARNDTEKRKNALSSAAPALSSAFPVGHAGASPLFSSSSSPLPPPPPPHGLRDRNKSANGGDYHEVRSQTTTSSNRIPNTTSHVAKNAATEYTSSNSDSSCCVAGETGFCSTSADGSLRIDCVAKERKNAIHRLHIKDMELQPRRLTVCVGDRLEFRLEDSSTEAGGVIGGGFRGAEYEFKFSSSVPALRLEQPFELSLVESVLVTSDDEDEAAEGGGASKLATVRDKEESTGVSAQPPRRKVGTAGTHLPPPGGILRGAPKGTPPSPYRYQARDRWLTPPLTAPGTLSFSEQIFREDEYMSGTVHVLTPVAYARFEEAEADEERRRLLHQRWLEDTEETYARDREVVASMTAERTEASRKNDNGVGSGGKEEEEEDEEEDGDGDDEMAATLKPGRVVPIAEWKKRLWSSNCLNGVPTVELALAPCASISCTESGICTDTASGNVPSSSSSSSSLSQQQQQQQQQQGRDSEEEMRRKREKRKAKKKKKKAKRRRQREEESKGADDESKDAVEGSERRNDPTGTAAASIADTTFSLEEPLWPMSGSFNTGVDHARNNRDIAAPSECPVKHCVVIRRRGFEPPCLSVSAGEGVEFVVTDGESEHSSLLSSSSPSGFCVRLSCEPGQSTSVAALPHRESTAAVSFGGGVEESPTLYPGQSWRSAFEIAHDKQQHQHPGQVFEAIVRDQVYMKCCRVTVRRSAATVETSRAVVSSLPPPSSHVFADSDSDSFADSDDSFSDDDDNDDNDDNDDDTRDVQVEQERQENGVPGLRENPFGAKKYLREVSGVEPKVAHSFSSLAPTSLAANPQPLLGSFFVAAGSHGEALASRESKGGIGMRDDSDTDSFASSDEDYDAEKRRLATTKTNGRDEEFRAGNDDDSYEANHCDEEKTSPVSVTSTPAQTVGGVKSQAPSSSDNTACGIAAAKHGQGVGGVVGVANEAGEAPQPKQQQLSPLHGSFWSPVTPTSPSTSPSHSSSSPAAVSPPLPISPSPAALVAATAPATDAFDASDADGWTTVVKSGGRRGKAKRREQSRRAAAESSESSQSVATVGNSEGDEIDKEDGRSMKISVEPSEDSKPREASQEGEGSDGTKTVDDRDISFAAQSRINELNAEPTTIAAATAAVVTTSSAVAGKKSKKKAKKKAKGDSMKTVDEDMAVPSTPIETPKGPGRRDANCREEEIDGASTACAAEFCDTPTSAESESGLSVVTPGTVANRLAVWKEEAGWESPVPLQPSPVVEPRLANSRIDTGADGCGGAEKDGLQEEGAANQEEEEEIRFGLVSSDDGEEGDIDDNASEVLVFGSFRDSDEEKEDDNADIRGETKWRVNSKPEHDDHNELPDSGPALLAMLHASKCEELPSQPEPQQEASSYLGDEIDLRRRAKRLAKLERSVNAFFQQRYAETLEAMLGGDHMDTYPVLGRRARFEVCGDSCDGVPPGWVPPYGALH